MKAKHFKKLRRETDLNKILYDYMFNELPLTNNQLGTLLEKRGEKKYPHYAIKEVINNDISRKRVTGFIKKRRYI